MFIGKYRYHPKCHGPSRIFEDENIKIFFEEHHNAVNQRPIKRMQKKKSKMVDSGVKSMANRQIKEIILLFEMCGHRRTDATVVMLFISVSIMSIDANFFIRIADTNISNTFHIMDHYYLMNMFYISWPVLRWIAYILEVAYFLEGPRFAMTTIDRRTTETVLSISILLGCPLTGSDIAIRQNISHYSPYFWRWPFPHAILNFCWYIRKK